VIRVVVKYHGLKFYVIIAHARILTVAHIFETFRFTEKETF